ncbi:two-partner secretion domain-containing protein [Dryocola clanedunensis]|uniref:two-partner secretion domain-containing protein n=1 Tax=Cedecea sulfonylureivorans TaxID=3051154 RepID=UPI001F32B65D|nr:hemagglutinin repeat-containing protein [Cedecea sulfonylureivorans]
MNKNRYRVIYNKARGMLMVVADIAASGRAASSSSSCVEQTAQRTCALSRLSFSLLLALGCISVNAQAGLVADNTAAKNQRPTIINSANGTPQVNIQTPNGKGVSHNKYSQFDVNQRGVILNNSHKAAQSQLGGMVTANPWLAKGEAKIILSEVNSRNPSQLNGAIEVAGQRAQVIIANPAGITCDGCGFINASRSTLTTGQTQLSNGQVTGYDVRLGEIVIQGRGMDSTGQDSTDLIARTVKVNAGIWANELNVTAGQNLVAADHQAMKKQTSASPSPPAVAIDVSQLGGMYAQKIRLIGTEKGVGVRNAGSLGASAGSVTVTADGRIENSGSLYAAENMTVSATENLVNSGIIAGGKQTQISAKTIDASKQSVFAAGVDSTGKSQSAGELTLNSQGRLNAHGQNIAAGSLRMQGVSVDISDSRTAGGSLAVSASENINTSRASVSAQKTLKLSTAILDNNTGIIRSGEMLEIASERLDNSKGLLSSGAAMKVSDTSAGQALNINNLGGTMIAGQSLDLVARSLTGDGQVLSQGDMSLALSQAFHNQGEVIANGTLTFSTPQSLTNDNIIKAGGVLNLDAASLLNSAAAEISAGENHLRIAGALANRGLIDGGLTHIDSVSLLNTGTGRIYGDHIAIITGTLDNLAEDGTAATIASREQLDIGAGTINNLDHGLIYSGGSLAIGGALDENLTATGQTDRLNNHSSTVESAGDMWLSIGQINNINDNLVTRTVVTEQSAHHEGGLSGATQRFDWADIDTSSKNKYGVHKAKMPDGTSGNTFYEYKYDRTVTETQVVETDPGQIIAGGSMTIKSRELNNHDSRIVAGGLLSAAISTLNNVATMGEQITTDVGKQTRWYARKKHSITGTKTSQGTKKSNYQPAPVVRTIDLKTMACQGNVDITSSGTTIARRDTSSLSQGLPTMDGMTTSTPELRLPDGSLFRRHPENTATYLIETDPRFTDRKKWLSSDYMMQAFIADPNNIQKRLGDGYYEQRLIREQVIALTGQRYLGETRSDEEQYKMLMNNGIEIGQKWGLKPGVALTAEQMSQLTTDIVWMVNQTVLLPDSSRQQVLVPQVYAKGVPGDLDGSGALLAGRQVGLAVGGDLTNSGTIAGRDVTQLTAENLFNSGLISGGQVNLQARNDITNTGGTLWAADALTAYAGRDFTSSSTLRGADAERHIDRVAGIYVQNDDGQLGLQAGNDMNLTATDIGSAGSGSLTQILAGHDLTMGTLTITHSESGSWGKGTDRTLTQSTDVGTQISAGDIQLQAGHDVSARAATVNARSDLLVVAGNDISIREGDAAFHLTENSRQTAKGALSKKTTLTHDEISSRTAVGSDFGGDTVRMQAGHDLTVQGSSVAGTGDLSLAAGNSLAILDAQESRQEDHQRQVKKTGLSGTGGIGVSYGKKDVKTTDAGSTLTSAGSTVGSINGSVDLTAGNTLTVKGSDVLAGRDINLTGKAVNILAADSQSSQTHKVEQKQSGLTLALSGTVGSAISTAVSSANTAGNEDSGRLAALNGVKAALSGVQAYQGTQLSQAQGGNPESMIGVNLSYGSQSSTSEQTQTNRYSQGSTVQAGKNLSVSATGTDVHVQGSQLQAGNDLTLGAKRDVLLDSGVNTSRLDGKNESHGGAVGVGINFGQGSNGLTVNASGNKSRGNERGNGTTHSETTLDAGSGVSIVSGRDTALTGAQVSGSRVTMDVGRSLVLTSEQDSDSYDSKQTRASGGISGSMSGGSASVNLARDKMHSTWVSVIEQTGIFAGKGGFDITVGEHTQLNGAVIGSTGSAEKNRLDTGTLGFGDINNHAEYKVEHLSIGASTGGSIADQFTGNMANSLLVGVNGSDSADSTTRSAVSNGTITIRDKDSQTQDVASLSRDVAHANQTLSPIFDKEKEQRRLQEAQLIGEIGSQAADIARTQGDINGLEKAKEKHPELSADELRKTDVYKTEMQKYGTGSAIQQGIQAATAAVQGLAGGDIAGALANGAAPYITKVIADSVDDPAARTMAHAVVNAALAAA